jgi:hypothetical protein
MTIIIEEGAQRDYFEAEDYYEIVRPGYGLKFRVEFQSTLQRINDFPLAWRTIEDDYRCCRINRFPYAVIYLVEGDVVYVAAVFDLRRMPGSWKSPS